MKNRTRRDRNPPPAVITAPPRWRRFFLPLAAVLLIGGAIAAWMLVRTRSGARTAPDIILITVDTLRADALGYAGNENVSTPFLDDLARKSVVFTNARAHNVVTLPSHANILTGLLPYQHGIRDNAGFVLDQKIETLATMLREAGYATGAFVGAFPLDAKFGLGRGFDVYDDNYPQGGNARDFAVAERPATDVLSAARSWFDSVTDRQRFLWVHLYDPHAPYVPPASLRARYASQPYLGEVAGVDAALAAFVPQLLEKNANTVVIVTSDHGEALGDHGELTHGLFAYDATLRVPLLVYDPSIEPRVEQRNVWHVDLAPTIAERAGIPLRPEWTGRSLAKVETSRDGYFEALSASLNRGWAPLVGLVHQGHKYIDLPIPELYDLGRDPAEARNVIEEQRRVAFAARKALSQGAPATDAARNAPIEEQQKLLSLGYITGSAAKKQYTIEDDPKRLVDIDSDLHRTIDLYQHGRHDEAIALARQILRKRPGMAAGEEMLAFLLQEGEQGSDAIEVLEAAVRNGTATDVMKIRLGRALSEAGRAREAVTLLAPFASGSDPDVLNAYGIALADTGRVDEAIAQFSRILAIDANNALAYQNLGIVALRAGERERARGYLQKALALNERLPLAANTLGVVEAQSQRPDAAIALWKRAVALDPKQYDALLNLAAVAGQTGRRQEAKRALEQFVATAPEARYAKDLVRARAMLARM